MSLDTTAKTVYEGIGQGVKLADVAIKKAWSLLDAATEKQRPSEALSTQAISAIQGNAPETSHAG